MNLPFDDLKKIDLVGFIESRGVRLTRAGSKFKACCPFHSEKTPSFMVSPDHGTWHCFGGCENDHGDAVDFEMAIKNLERIPAAKNVAAWAGVPWPELGQRDPAVEEAARAARELKKTIFAALEAACVYYQKALQDKKHTGPGDARKYIKDRELTQAVEPFRLGFAPGTGGFIKYMNDLGFGPEARIAAGITAMSADGKFEYQRFKNRLMIPICDSLGKVLSFTGRDLTGKANAKYLNGSITAVFQKSEILFAMDHARGVIGATGQALIVEGHLDAMSMHLAGFKNAVACQGSAFTPQHADVLAKAGCGDAVIIPDGDSKMKLAPVLDSCLAAALPVRAVELPPNIVYYMPAGGPNGEKEFKWDPDAIVRSKKYGPAYLRDCIQNAPDLIIQTITAAAEKAPPGRTKLKTVADVVKPIIDRLAENQREWLVHEAAKIFDFKLSVIRKTCGIKRPSSKKKAQKQPASNTGAAANMGAAARENIQGPPDAPPADPPPIPYEALFTHAGNAYRFVHYYGDDLLYSHEEKKWHFWDSKRWQIDNIGRATRLATDMWKLIMDEARHPSANGTAEGLAKWAVKSQDGHIIDQAEKKARSFLPVVKKDWDSHKYLLCAGNGVVDLRTGELKPHNRQLKMRMMTDVPYDPTCKTTLIDSLMNEWHAGDQEIINYIWATFGHSATADISEQLLYVHTGTGKNGKSTLFDTILKIFGDYGAVLNIEALLYKEAGANSLTPELAAMENKRFVVVTEPEASARVSESFIKRATGDCRLMVNPKNRDPFEMEPEFHIYIQTNHEIQIQGTDEGIWRRQRHIPWNVKIPEEKRIKDLQEKLVAEWPGILAKIVDWSVLWWNEKTLPTPAKVIKATNEKRAAQDQLGSFINDFCVLAPEKYCKASQLHKAYEDSCEGVCKPMSSTMFGREMVKREGITRVKGVSGRIYYGIGLIATGTQENQWQ